MRVLAATTAGAGHLAGVLPFARACAAAGHEVRMAAPASFAAAVEGAGFIHVPLGDADPAALGAVFGRIPTLTMHEADDLVVSEVFGRLDLGAALPAMRAAVHDWRPDVVLREPGELASYVVAQESGIPHVQAAIGLSSLDDRVLPLLEQPLASVGTEGLRAAPRWTTVPPSFDVPSALAHGPLTHARDPGAAAPAVRPLPDWWGGRTDPLAYVSFGSVAAGVGFFPHLYAAALAQLADLPVRVLLTLGEAADPAALGPLPGNVHVERWWPQQDVMPHASVVVGHGGFGTTQAALVAGLPQVVLPLFSFDQFANAAQVAAVGVGAALVDPGKDERRAGDVVPHGPDALHRLSEAVAQVLEDEAVRERARAVAAEIAALPSAAACVDALRS